MIVISLGRLRPYLRFLALLAVLGFLGLGLPWLLKTLADVIFRPGRTVTGDSPGAWDVLSRWLEWLLERLSGFMEGETGLPMGKGFP